jgi:predicted DNA-binding transcriptional regulator AlpA
MDEGFIDRAVRWREAPSIVGMGETKVRQLERDDPDFPKTFPLTGRARAFSLRELLAWLDRQKAQRQQPPQPAEPQRRRRVKS